MGKEVKIGLAVIGVLLVTFGVVLYKRLCPATPAAVSPAPLADSAAAADPAAAALPGKPTVVTAAAELDNPQAGAQQAGGWQQRADRFARQAAATGDDRAEPPRSFLPDAADVSTDPRYGAQPAASLASGPADGGPADGAPPDNAPAAPAGNGAGGPVAADPLMTAVPATAPAGADPSAGDVTAADPAAGNPAGSAAGVPQQNADAAVMAPESMYRGDRSGLRAASHDQEAADPRAGFGPPRQDRYGDGSRRADGPAEPAALPADRYPLAAMPAGRADLGDPGADPRARFAAGAYAAPGQTGAPTAAEPGKYVVQPNDNYWTVSEKVYGTGGFFKALHELNRAEHPRSDRLQVGDVLAVPPVAELHRRFPDLCPKPKHVRTASQVQAVAAGARQRAGANVYVVEQGDTLFDIARYKLGKASRWAEIYELNRDTLGTDFDYLRPGTELVLPTEDRGDALTRQRNEAYQR